MVQILHNYQEKNNS